MTVAHAPSVSVIIAAHDAAATIGECLDSVLAQSHSDLEVVVCDDGSTDGTTEVVRARDDTRLRLLVNTVNAGAGPARDRAIAASTGRWLAVIDADDAWHSDRLRRLLAVAAGNPNAIVFDDIVLCHASPMGLKPFRRVHGRNGFGSRGAPTRVSTERYLSGRRLVAQPLFSRELMQASGASHGNRKSGQDLDFRFSLLSTKGELHYLPEPLYLYRMSPGSLSSTSHGASYIQIFEDARTRFAGKPELERVLDRKISRMLDKATLVRHLRDRSLLQATFVAMKRPKALIDLVHNLYELIHYQASRRLHRAPARWP